MSRITKHREHKKSTKALRKALDKTKGFVYNLLQTLLAFLIAMSKKPKGVLHKIFARISRGVPAISQFSNFERRPHMATFIRRTFGATHSLIAKILVIFALGMILVACGGGGSVMTGDDYAINALIALGGFLFAPVAMFTFVFSISGPMIRRYILKRGPQHE
jgi:hypothetical protein